MLSDMATDAFKGILQVLLQFEDADANFVVAMHRPVTAPQVEQNLWKWIKAHPKPPKGRGKGSASA